MSESVAKWQIVFNCKAIHDGAWDFYLALDKKTEPRDMALENKAMLKILSSIEWFALFRNYHKNEATEFLLAEMLEPFERMSKKMKYHISKIAIKSKSSEATWEGIRPIFINLGIVV